MKLFPVLLFFIAGFATEYYENGALKKEVVFKNGVVAEPCKNYDEKGDMYESKCMGIY